MARLVEQPAGDVEQMTQKMQSQTQPSVRDELLHAAVSLLDERGPDALQARKVAGAAGTSTMTVYTPVADLLATGVAYRRYAIQRPHMYRLMFGSTSAHGINAPAHNVLTLTVTEIEKGIPSFAHVVRAVHRSMLAGRITGRTTGSTEDDTASDTTIVAIAAQVWALIHGFVMLELAGFYGHDGSAVEPVLASMTTNLLVALGDSPERVKQSQRAALGARGTHETPAA